MPDITSITSTLKRAIKNSTRQAQGSRLRHVTLVWRGYIEALREAEVLSDDEHAAIAELLADVPDDPMAEGWKVSGWLASFSDPEADTAVETLDLAAVARARRAAAG